MRYITKTYHDFMRFADKNPEYLFCSLVYYFVAVWWIGWGLWSVRIGLAVLYVLSLVIAFSPLGEKLLRLFSNVRRPETAVEKNLLLPLLDDVLAAARLADAEAYISSNGSVSGVTLDSDVKIDIYIKDIMTINAFAIGKHTV
jgi:hypothetical protein